MEIWIAAGVVLGVGAAMYLFTDWLARRSAARWVRRARERMDGK